MRRREATGVLLVSIVALARADNAVIGVVAPALRAQFHLDDVRLGVLASVSSGTGAVFALPAGGLVDRRRRALVLTVALVGWSFALGVAGLATGFAMLAGARLVTGAISTVARPAAVSLIGDTYRPDERGRVMARLDAGQTAGTAACFLIGAVATRFLDWRWAFWWLAAIGLGLAFGATRWSEPAAVRPPSPPLGSVLRALMQIPTNVVVLVADGLATLFYAGVTSFAVLYASNRYGVSPSLVDALAPLVGVGAIAGILGGGRLGDHLARRSSGGRRLLVASACELVAVGLLVPAFVLRSGVASAVLLFLAAAALGGSGPCLDAVRLDVVPSSIRGRAEASRGLLILGSSLLGPVIFGVLGTTLAGHRPGSGLRNAFLIMLLPLTASALILLAGLRRYAADAAAAATKRPDSRSPDPGEVGFWRKRGN